MKKKQSNNITTLEDVRLRQMALKNEMAIQKSAMLYGVQDIYDDIKPAKLVFDMIGSVMGGFIQKISISQLAINTISGWVIKNAKARQFLKWAIPISLSILPELDEQIRLNGGYSSFFNNIKAVIKRSSHKMRVFIKLCQIEKKQYF